MRGTCLRITLCVLILFVVLLVGGGVYLRVSAAPEVPKDLSWFESGRPELPPDGHIRSMARRAQLDYLCNPLPDIGFGFIWFLRAYRSASGEFELVFAPRSPLDAFVLYHFSPEGRMLAKEHQ